MKTQYNRINRKQIEKKLRRKRE